MRFEIRAVHNGAILRVETDGPDGTETEELVYQEIDGGEIEAFAAFLRELNDHYGPSTSRYSPRRIHVIVEPGDKYEEPRPHPD
jgi:hypothetical protein